MEVHLAAPSGGMEEVGEARRERSIAVQLVA